MENTTATYVVVGIGLLTFVGYKMALFVKNYVRSHRKLWKFPTDSPHRIFGHLFDHPGLNDSHLAYQRDLVKKFPMTSVMWLMNFPILSVNHPATLSGVLKNSNAKGSLLLNLIRPWIGDGLLTSSDKQWQRNRRLLAPAFHNDLLKRYVGIQNRCADILVDKFVTAAETDTSIEACLSVGMCVLDILLRCSMTYETDCQLLGTKHPYVEATSKIQEIMASRFFKAWLHNDFLFSLTRSGKKFFEHCDYVHQVAEIIIKKRQAAMDYIAQKSPESEKKPRCLDLLDVLLTAKSQDGKNLTFKEIRDEVDTFLFTGYDSGASSLSWALYSIAQHPDIQSRIQEEIDSVLDHSNHADVKWDDLSKLQYLTMVIKETLRLHSPVHFFQRVLTTDTVLDGRIAPAGTVVSCELYSMHHNPLIWPNSMNFEPDRFLPQHNEKRHPYGFLPFSAGPRSCIGQNFAMSEMKIILARILHRVTIRLDPDHNVEKQLGLTVQAKHGIRLLVSER